MSSSKIKVHPVVKVLIIILVVIIALLIFSVIFYNSTRENEKRYVPSDFLGYITVDSLTDFYENIVDLRASEVILSQEKLASAYKALLDFRSSRLSRSDFVTNLLNMKINIILKKDYTPIFIVDLKFKSMLLRSSRFVVNFIKKQKSFSIDIIKNKSTGITIYKLTLESNNKEFYFSICKNLLFFGFNEADIMYLYNARESRDNIYDKYGANFLKKRFKKTGIADVYFNTEEMIDPFVSKDSILIKILEKINFDLNSAITFNISNEDVYLGTFTNYRIMDEKLYSLLKDSAAELDIVKYLPDDTNLYTALNIKSFKEFYQLFLYLQEGEYDDIIKKADRACKLLFQIDLEELLFSWIGREIGAYTSTVSNSPVVFLKIESKRKLDDVIEKITTSLILDEEEDLEFDRVTLNKIVLPDFLQNLIRLFIKGFDTPYYVKVDDFIFFSMDPFALSNQVNKHKDKQTLSRDKTFDFITSNTGKKGNIFLYFNLTESMPKFLQNRSFFSEILKLYEKGALSINFDNSNLEIELSAAGVNIKKVKVFPGYPKKALAGLSSPVICQDVAGSGVSELIYVTDKKTVMVADINNNPIDNFPVPIDSNSEKAPFVGDLDRNGNKEIYLLSDKGIFHRIDHDGKELRPYPIKTDFDTNIGFVPYKDTFIFYDKKKKKLVSLKNKTKKDLSKPFDKPILAPVSLYNDLIAYYPKSFDGTIYLMNGTGEILDGWPRDAGGIGFGSPVFSDINGGNAEILFITQAGKLHAWDLNGTPISKFPVTLNGIFYTQVVAGDIKGGRGEEIVALSKDGLVYLVSGDGEILKQKELKYVFNKETRLKLYDANGNGKKEIYIYGGTNNIIALDFNLDIMPGFPVKGSTEPFFTDFNFDGQTEMVTSSIDDFIIIYTIPQ